MPSNLHEWLLELFRNRSATAADLLRSLEVPLPQHDVVRIELPIANSLRPVEYVADLVLFLARGSRYVFGIIVEVQLSRDEDNPYVWPVLFVFLCARHSCPVGSLVITVEDSIARWAARSIDLGPAETYDPVSRFHFFPSERRPAGAGGSHELTGIQISERFCPPLRGGRPGYRQGGRCGGGPRRDHPRTAGDPIRTAAGLDSDSCPWRLGCAAPYSCKACTDSPLTPRGDGFVIDPHELGVTDISYPVFDMHGEILAALTVHFLRFIDGSQNLSLEVTQAMLDRTARRISAELASRARPLTCKADAAPRMSTIVSTATSSAPTLWSPTHSLPMQLVPSAKWAPSSAPKPISHRALAAKPPPPSWKLPIKHRPRCGHAGNDSGPDRAVRQKVRLM